MNTFDTIFILCGLLVTAMIGGPILAMLLIHILEWWKND